MKSVLEELLKFNNRKKLTRYAVLTLLFLATIGCVEEAAKVIVIPARTGPSGCAIFFGIIILFICALCDQHKTNQTFSQEAVQPIEQTESSLTDPVPTAESESRVEPESTPSPPERESIPREIEEQPAPEGQMTRRVDIAIPYFLPQGTQIEVWTLENGVEGRQLSIASTSQSAGTLHIVLEEEIPIGTQCKANWVIPPITERRKPHRPPLPYPNNRYYGQ